MAVPEMAYQDREAEPEIADAAEVPAHNGASLSDDQMSALAEQLAEAKHEEAQAEAEDLPEVQETAAEPFVESAELEELQDALHDDHEADAAEAEETADAMHDEALAAESAPEPIEEHSGAGSAWSPQEQNDTPEGARDAAGALRCGAETANAVEARVAAGVRMNTGLSSTRIRIRGTNSTGVRC